jgi:hypothetical protein
MPVAAGAEIFSDAEATQKTVSCFLDRADGARRQAGGLCGDGVTAKPHAWGIPQPSQF